MPEPTTGDILTILAILAAVLYGIYRVAVWAMKTARTPEPRHGPHTDPKLLFVRRYRYILVGFLAVMFAIFFTYWLMLFFRYVM